MAHTFDTSAQTTSATSPVTTTYTSGAGSTVLVIGITYPGNATRAGGAPTYNGVALTQAGTTVNSTSNTGYCELWYLLGVPTGVSYTVSVPNTGTLSLNVCISTYKAPTGFISQFDVTAQANATSTNPTVSLTTTAPSAVVSTLVCANAPTAGQTLLFTGTNTTRYGNEYALQSAAGAISMNWTATNGRWGTVAAAFKEAPTSTNQFMLMGIGS